MSDAGSPLRSASRPTSGPLFREHDRTAMVWAFDLWSPADVGEHADAILRAVAAGSMPCDTTWPEGPRNATASIQA